MRRIALYALMLLMALPAMAQRTELYDGELSLEIPAGFRPMTGGEIAIKYPRSQPPQFAFTDGDPLAQTIAVSRLRFSPGRPPPLSELGSQMQQRIAVQAGVKINRQGTVEVGGRQWYALEFTSAASEEPVETLLRITTGDNYILILTVHSISRLYGQQEAALRAAIDSVSVR